MKTLMNFQVCLQGEHSESAVIVDADIVFVVISVVIVVVIVVFVIVSAISRWLIGWLIG